MIRESTKKKRKKEDSDDRVHETAQKGMGIRRV